MWYDEIVKLCTSIGFTECENLSKREHIISYKYSTVDVQYYLELGNSYICLKSTDSYLMKLNSHAFKYVSTDEICIKIKKIFKYQYRKSLLESLL